MSKKRAARRKSVWMAGSNLSGLWSSRPIEGFWDDELKEFYDTHGDLSVSRVGLDVSDGSYITTFASEDKEMVKTWISGWMTAMQQVVDRIPK